MSEPVLQGKVAIVTGAGSPIGLGRAMTLALVRAGARVAMLDFNPETLAATAAEMRAVGGPDCVLPILTDVSDPAACEAAVQRTIAELGGLHVLVNNAGTVPRNLGYAAGNAQPFWELNPEAWAKVVAINLSGNFYMARAVAPHLIAQGWGRIVGVTTSLDTMYRRGQAPYGPAKAGHEAFIALMAQDLEGTGVTANVLTPGGASNTNLLPANMPNRERLIAPEVMQAPVVWLASDASDGFSGQRIVGYFWDEALPLEQRLAKAAAPAAWPQLGRQAVVPAPTF